MTTLILFGVFAIMLIIGVPIAVSLGVATASCFLYLQVPFVTITQRMFASLDSSTLLAIPLFVLAGNIMTKGGISRRLVDFVNSITGNIRGSLGVTAVIACAFFAALSGSGPATVIAIGSMVYPAMKEMGYPQGESAGLLAVAGGLGPIIPPSIIMVVYASLTDSSIKDMFTVGAIWGVFIAVILCAVVLFRANIKKWPKVYKKVTIKEFAVSSIKALPALFLPIIILGGIYSGLFTPTEAAGVAAIYSVFVSIFIYKELKFKNMYNILIDSAKGSAIILFIIASASAFAWLFSFAGLSDGILKMIVSLNINAMGFMILSALLLTVFGCFLDGISIAVLLVPMLFTVAKHLGINPIYFGMMFCFTNSAGCMTPPVAVNIFSIANVSKLSIEDITKGEMPYFIAIYFVLLLIILFPQLTMMMIGR